MPPVAARLKAKCSMNDLISRSALCEKLQAHHDFFVNAWGGFGNLPLKDKARVDEITHCIAETMNAPAVDAGPKWISVKDALPEESAFVLCLLSGRYKNVSYENAYVIGTYYADDGWILEEAPRWENPPVTHWMPLPEPPKEG